MSVCPNCLCYFSNTPPGEGDYEIAQEANRRRLVVDVAKSMLPVLVDAKIHDHPMKLAFDWGESFARAAGAYNQRGSFQEE